MPKGLVEGEWGVVLMITPLVGRIRRVSLILKPGEKLNTVKIEMLDGRNIFVPKNHVCMLEDYDPQKPSFGVMNEEDHR